MKKLLILCASSLRAIAPDEILAGLNESWKPLNTETLSFDFTDLVEGGVFKTPGEAVRRLTNPQGALLNAIARSHEVDLAFGGMAHIPIQFLMGHLVSNRIPVRLFEQHLNDGQISWAWADEQASFPEMEVYGMPESVYSIGDRSLCWPPKDVILRVSVTFPIRADQTAKMNLPEALEIDLTLPQPTWGIVKSEQQVWEYGRMFRRVLDQISNNLPFGQRIHLFYAGPNSLGFHLGQQISENIHPPVIVWNYHQGCYDWGIDLAAAYSKQLSIVYN